MDIDFTMNERIQELLSQAGLYVDLNGRPWPRAMSAEESEATYKKFAELIVQDCIGKVTKVSDSIKEFDSDNVDGIDLCDLITYHIKKHFGVES